MEGDELNSALKVENLFVLGFQSTTFSAQYFITHVFTTKGNNSHIMSMPQKLKIVAAGAVCCNYDREQNTTRHTSTK